MTASPARTSSKPPSVASRLARFGSFFSVRTASAIIGRTSVVPVAAARSIKFCISVSLSLPDFNALTASVIDSDCPSRAAKLTSAAECGRFCHKRAIASSS